MELGTNTLCTRNLSAAPAACPGIIVTSHSFFVRFSPTAPRTDDENSNAALLNVSPPKAPARMQKARAGPAAAAPGQTVAATINIGHYQGVPSAEFDDTTEGVPTSLQLRLHNTLDEAAEIELEPTPARYHLTASTTRATLGPKQSETITITWAPEAAGGQAAKLTFAFREAGSSRRCKLQAKLTGTALPKQTKKKKKRKVTGNSVGSLKPPAVKPPRAPLRAVPQHNAKPDQAAASGTRSARAPLRTVLEHTSSNATGKRGPRCKVGGAATGAPSEAGGVPVLDETLAESAPPPAQEPTLKPKQAPAKLAAAKQAAKPKPVLKKVKMAKAGGAGRKLRLKTTKAQPLRTAPCSRPTLQPRKRIFDEHWQEKQEHGLTEWVNFVVNPPDEDEEMAKELEAASDDSSKGTFRLLQRTRQEAKVRRQAYDTYVDTISDELQMDIERQISSGVLMIRPDRDLFADVGLRESFVELLFSYNSAWLRAGLETTFGEVIDMKWATEKEAQAEKAKASESAAEARKRKKKKSRYTPVQRVLRAFILERVLRDPVIQEKYSKDLKCKQHAFLGADFKAMMARKALKRFLLLVIFLDSAKKTNLIPRTPCLFTKTAAVKSSRDMLKSFCRDYMTASGDIIRQLGQINYNVDFEQKTLHEFDFSVDNIKTGLRDGVRLVRLVETLQEDESQALSAKLRVPAVSRLQKLHNVELALDSLRSCEPPLEFSASKKDVVDGNRDKTLGLLWSILLRWKLSGLISASELENEIEMIEASSRRKSRSKLDEGVEEELYPEQKELQLLMRWCRAVCKKYGVRVYNFTSSFSDGRALCALINYYHPGLLPASQIKDTTAHLTQKEFGASAEEMSQLGDWVDLVSDKVGEREFKQALANERANFALAAERAAELGSIPVTMQAFDSSKMPEEKSVITFVAYLCARLLDSCKEIRATLRIQNYYRAYYARTHLVWRNAAARKIQNYWLAKNEQRVLQHQIVRCRRAATCIQTLVRKQLQCTSFKQMRNASIKVQCCVRVVQAIARRQAVQMEQSAIVVQAVVRHYQATWAYQTQRGAA
eukprot:g4943.t1